MHPSMCPCPAWSYSGRLCRKSICNMEEASESLQQSLLEVQAEVSQRDEEHAAEVRRLEAENEQTQVPGTSASLLRPA